MGVVAVVLAMSAGSSPAESPITASDSVALRNARLSAAIKRQLARVITSELAGAVAIDAEDRRIALDSQMNFVHLSSNGSQTIWIRPSDKDMQDTCAPNGNCISWLFLLSGSHALLILEDGGEGIWIEKTSHHGMRDLATYSRFRDGDISVAREELHFDGKKYQPFSCSISGEEDENGAKIPPHPCNETGKSN
jgi:hypothetical protein